MKTTASTEVSIKDRLRRFGFLVKIYRRIKALPLTVRQFLLRVIRVKNITKWRKYQKYIMNNQLDKKNFVPITSKKYSGKAQKKLIAYYLPQYYQIPQNDLWFGRGFTEWTNCAKATPQFIGHWQPHLPYDVGFYNLDTTKVMHRQVELAKMYGIHGFCFYYYWFSGGEKIMEKPINNWLNDKSLDFPFMLFWANEDWTNTWGEEADIGTKTYSAKMKSSDIEKFVSDIIPFLKDKRYIRIDSKPHIIIYQIKKDPFLSKFIYGIRKELQKRGVGEIYISLVFPDDFDDKFNPRDFYADAAVEFGSHLKTMPKKIPSLLTNNKIMNPAAKITEYDMKKFINRSDFIYDVDYPIFKGAMTHFDNTARKIYKGTQIFSLSPNLYRKWLSKLIAKSESDYIFITAWNEWAEGMHLEPDQRYGYAYLQATKDALEENE